MKKTQKSTSKKVTAKKATPKRSVSKTAKTAKKKVSTKNKSTGSLPILGEAAPSFSAPDQDGVLHSLEGYAGTWVLLYFYPKDDTPGCTKEACLLRDGFPFFEPLRAKVIGVSVDSVKSHKKFVEKYALPFTLLADVDKAIVKAYGVWGKKTFMGRTYLGTTRASFLIDPRGVIRKIYPKVNPATHADEVLADLKKLTRT